MLPLNSVLQYTSNALDCFLHDPMMLSYVGAEQLLVICTSYFKVQCLVTVTNKYLTQVTIVKYPSTGSINKCSSNFPQWSS